jgi:hypothetical protein
MTYIALNLNFIQEVLNDQHGMVDLSLFRNVSKNRLYFLMQIVLVLWLCGSEY